MNRLTYSLSLLLGLMLLALPAIAQDEDDKQDYRSAQEDEVPLLSTPGMTVGMGYGYGWGTRYGDRGVSTPYRTGYHDNEMNLTGTPSSDPTMLLAELNISKDQREEILEIHRDLMDDKIDMIRELREKREEVMEMHSSDDNDWDRDEMKELMVEMAGLRADIYSRTREAQAEANEILTDEQVEELRERGLFGLNRSMKMNKQRMMHGDEMKMQNRDEMKTKKDR